MCSALACYSHRLPSNPTNRRFADSFLHFERAHPRLSPICYRYCTSRRSQRRTSGRSIQELAEGDARNQYGLVEWPCCGRCGHEPCLVSPPTHLYNGFSFKALYGLTNIYMADGGRLLKILRKERDFMLSLTSLGLSSSQALDLISHSAIEAANGGSDLLDGLFDASDRPEDGDLILWWNDLEKDSKYARWPPSIFAVRLLTTFPSFPSFSRLKPV